MCHPSGTLERVVLFFQRLEIRCYKYAVPTELLNTTRNS